MKEWNEKFGYEPNMENIDKTLSNIQNNLANWATPHYMESCIGYTDLTSLKSEDTPSKIIAFTQKVNDLKATYPDYPAPASICVYPNFSKIVKETLTVPGVDITTVAG